MNKCEEIKECIACGHTELTKVLDLNDQPLANSFKSEREEYQDYFPLAINHCNHCFHVQLTHKVNPDLLFKNYLYVSGTAKTQLEYFDWFAKFAIEQSYRPAKTILDIGCNDGSQLDYFKKYGLGTFGIDPAENLFEISSKKHNVICGYFNEQTFSENVHFDIITCQNAFAHNYDQLGFLKSVSNIMDDNSLLYITTSQADMILNNEFDTIYHEHLSFYNIKSMNELCKRAGLNLIDVNKHTIHGTSYIFVISKNRNRDLHIANLISYEESKGLFNPNTYVKYAKKCNNVVDSYKKSIFSLRQDGYTIVGYGAPAKGNTFLNYCLGGVPDFIVDDNPLKQGLYTPGVSVPVYGSDFLLKYSDVEKLCFVPLAWNFYDEIKNKIMNIRDCKNDIFIKYFPILEVEIPTVMHHPV
jgi:2-polyprenyl-3-methyl-5-hydroxy-6-metoxy-1,4-benzoquinol methylase